MPQIIVKNVKKDELESIADLMLFNLSKIIGCELDTLSLELIESAFINVKYPIIQINWFARPKNIQDAVAEEIDGFLRRLGYQQRDVFFIVLEKERYYDNGVHY